MTREDFRERMIKRPFQPFTVIMADGQRIPVWNQEYVMMSPTRRTASVYQRDGRLDIIDLLLVTALEVEGPIEAGAQGS